MADLDKNIIITPNIGQSAAPNIRFLAANSSVNAQTITMTAMTANDGTLMFSGNSGNLFSISSASPPGGNVLTIVGATTITGNLYVTGIISGNTPAFGAYQSTLQALPAATYTKINFQTEEFDTHNCFDNATNYRFLPTVAGYYQLNASMALSAGSSEGYILFRKNGSAIKAGNDIGGTAYGVTVSSIVSLNGSTDYVEVWGYSGTALNTSATQSSTYFNGCLLRPL